MNSDKRADFSAVTAKVDTTADITPKADFSAVQAHVDTTAEQVQQIYVVKSGDSLSKIAKLHYGDGNAWTRIFEANRDVLDDPDKIYPGQTLKLPARA
ncbi:MULTISPECIES: LysM peptidoglycan-binding domain-containing protein [Xanthomonas translucens group]|jgi:nucleoid-associated protein YgaU|uniref:Potassium binding protein Kbp n=1 Tax=Xanthomonas graminis pv. poae TaxID=227946 RepID=A0A199NYJ1_9XANT|nr:LysM peptidoglycan-binding domain-containing protein [Xanthomonas translucens]AVY65235.1 peptidoglycan-binding protein LysM [Xanthomonas translucens pv. undulosa]KTF41555.1 peptidoglycan-binding protein LysM [Xanthomonas translucens pv. translucens]KWV14351.1 peptidoglycan-binding protein LysM [Xanthomonas translucens]MCS3360706.1 LysM peptidoglycan-binding domain-containing protein [Xanthomonas translucens pv. translucens]MCS3374547.1 LysM peptidoglycan-binding domain-containing protein [X